MSPGVNVNAGRTPPRCLNNFDDCHHLGAIAMARVELQHGKDDEARKMAQKTIDQQSAEVEEMTKWVEEHAKQ